MAPASALMRQKDVVVAMIRARSKSIATNEIKPNCHTKKSQLQRALKISWAR